MTVAVLAAGLQLLVSPAFAGYELPPGERITNLPAIPRNMPQKEAYENYDPVIGRNFDTKNLWLRADLRVRPEFRNGECFGGGGPVAGTCNSQTSTRSSASPTSSGNTFFVSQWVRLGIGYDLSPDVKFYFEMIDSINWGTSGSPLQQDTAGNPSLNHAGTANSQELGVRAAYALIRNLGDVQGLSMKVGRQYVIFGNHSLFGHFDWANTGYSHDGVMFQYSTKNFDSYFGWFREADCNIGNGQVATGGVTVNNCGNNAATGLATAVNATNSPNGGRASNAANLFIFYNQIKSVPGFLIEPHYILYSNDMPICTAGNGGGSCGAGINNTGVWRAKAADQIRHNIGNRTEMRKGNWDAINEIEYQFGRMSSGLVGSQKDLHINAWATRNWLGYTWYESAYKPRVAVSFEYASGDGNANCTSATGAANAGYKCSTANTFENFYPTNHIHMGYMDVMAWKNMWAPGFNYQIRPSERDHFEFWFNSYNLANKNDNWYRGSQGVYVFTKQGNTAGHIGDETDYTWTRMFADGKVALQATYGYMWSGNYIKQNLGQNGDQQWGYLSLWMNF
ncbi:MAG: alginate export family protein [Nitrospirota bacterium]|nr:alginate export family protein [Nitrospirota bacterium]